MLSKIMSGTLLCLAVILGVAPAAGQNDAELRQCVAEAPRLVTRLRPPSKGYVQCSEWNSVGGLLIRRLVGRTRGNRLLSWAHTSGT